MAALSLQSVIQISRLQGVVPATGFLIQRISYSDCASEKIRPIKKPSLASLKRGTGGRSSFSGIVATVFGGPGILGNHVCHRLGKIGSQIIIPYRGDHYELLRLRLAGELGQVLFLPFNLRDEDSIYKAVKYSNVVINLIGRDWETKNFTFHDVHVEGAARIARIAKKAGVEKLIHVSDLSAAEKPEGLLIKGGSKYLAKKWEGEQAVREEFPEAVIFRPAFTVGPNDKFVRMYTSVMRHSFGFYLPMYKKGEHTIKQPVFVYDVAEGIVRAVKDKDSSGKIYQAVGPKRYKLGDLADWFHSEMRIDINDKWAYRRYDMKYDPFFKFQVMLNEKLTLSWPVGGVHWDMIERESITDVVQPDLPTLEDLGVNLTPMEDCIPWILRPYIVDSYYDAELNEFAKPIPPQPVA